MSALKAYAEAWLEEHRYVENRSQQRNEYGVAPDLQSDETWHKLLKAKDDAYAALGLRDYVDAQEAVFAAFVSTQQSRTEEKA